MAPIHIIDIDEGVHIDLTAEPPTIMIDLTSDAEDDDHPNRPQTSPSAEARHTSTFPQDPTGPPSLIVPEIANRPASKRPQVTGVHNLGPPPKRRKHDQIAHPLPTVISPTKRSNTPIKRTVIELDSDGEETGSKKRVKQEIVDDPDNSDSEYSRIHAGFDLRDSSIWKPIKINEAKLESEVLDGIQQLTVSSPPSSRKHRHPDISDRIQRIQTRKHPPTFIWEALQMAANIHSPHKPRRSLLSSEILGRPTRRRQEKANSMECIASFKSSPGSINKIVQSGPLVAICSASIGGHPDRPGEEVNPYNRDGALMVWNESAQFLSGHQCWSNQFVKHYTVNDVKFDPCSPSIASSGNDKTVNIWERQSDDSYNEGFTWRYGHVPHDLAYKPAESVLAVAERKIYLYSNLSSSDVTETSLSLFGRKARDSVGALVWGRESTAAYLFASSEPPGDILVGCHKGFDVEVQKVAFDFDANEAGDAINITQDGALLALCTRGTERAHILRLYDIRNRNAKTIRTINLKSFPSDIEGEVNSAAFSPDGIHLAVARNDNHTHIYDSRKLDKLLFDFEHNGACRKSPGSDSYGIVHAEWVKRDSRRLPVGLVTGGHDGCVRFWDPLRSAEDPINGMILAETHSDVGFFSIGDHFAGERDLVVGDCAGEVSVFSLRC